ncbi:MAG: VWA domain-containing protein, partial [Gammaproteobacteria bacterium]|nr:VWA domain-containing protein [Gammaproteobacteria bacterium]
MKIIKYSLIGLLTVALGACGDSAPKTKGVYMLIDVSGTYKKEINKAQKIVNYLLANLNSGDSLVLAKIDSGSFSEKDIVAKVTFDLRPSTATAQKHQFKRKLDDFVSTAKPSRHTDISGAVLQAADYLRETDAKQKYIIIFSDLEEDLIKGHVRDFDIPLVDTKVIALNVTKLRSDNIDPRDYRKRLDAWEKRVYTGGGIWKVFNDLDHL